MKKIIFLFAVIFVASLSYSNAQNFEIKQSQNLTSVKGETLPYYNPASKDELEIKYINTSATNNNVGYATHTGPLTANGCISFTASQATAYNGAVLHTIKVGITTAGNCPQPDAAKVWIKTSLAGATVYEQNFTAVLGTYNEVVLTTPYTIGAGALVIGYTLTFNNITGQNTRPWFCSSNADPYQPGGFNLNTTTHGAGAVWSTFQDAGNLAIIGVATGTQPDNDLAAAGVSRDLTEFKLIDQSYDYVVAVANNGKNAQSNFTVQLIDDSNNVLATTTITETLPSGQTTGYTLPYSHLSPGIFPIRGRVINTGDQVPENDISSPLSCVFYPKAPMAYGTQHISSAFGYAGSFLCHMAIGFPVAEMAPYVNKELVGFLVGFSDVSGVDGYVNAWLRNSLDDMELWTAPIEAGDGWNLIEVDPPFVLASEDYYLGCTFDYVKTGSGEFGAYTISFSRNDINFNGFWLQQGALGWSNYNDPLDDQYQGVGNLTIIGMIKDIVDCDPASNLTIEYGASCDEALLTWEATGDKPFNVYRDNQRIATEITAATYTDTDFDATKEHTWKITVVCAEGESAAVSLLKPACSGGGIDNVGKIEFYVLPNPATNGNIIISSGTNFNTIEIVSFLGQTVLAQPNTGNSTSIDISNLADGIYFVRITADNGATNVKKFIKQ